MSDWVQLLAKAIAREARSRDFQVKCTGCSEGQIAWALYRRDLMMGELSSNGEVYDLKVGGDWHFYFFEYDSSYEVVGDVLDVLSEYSAGRYRVRRTLFGGERISVVTADGTEWEARRNSIH